MATDSIFAQFHVDTAAGVRKLFEAYEEAQLRPPEEDRGSSVVLRGKELEEWIESVSHESRK